MFEMHRRGLAAFSQFAAGSISHPYSPTRRSRFPPTANPLEHMFRPPMTPFQRIVDHIDLKSALMRGTESNDLLPPRPEDRVGGEVGNRFIEALKRSLERGFYDPTPAYFVQVPKSSHATRPAALLNLVDRVVLEALVTVLRPRIETALLGDGVVFWPRGELSEKAWRAFEQAPLMGSDEYVIIADVSAFYESIDHEQLAERLLRMTGRRAAAEALHALLDRTMGSHRGLPQGLAPSDALATAYIAQVDFAMVRDGYRYFRHGDDIRVAAPTYDDARRAILTLESRVREAGLQLNAYKSRILRRATYEDEARSIDDTIAETRQRLLQGRVDELSGDQKALEEALRAADKEQLGWDFFYHGKLSLHDVIGELRPHLAPDDRFVAERLFTETIASEPGALGALASDAFHQRLVASLLRLAAARSQVPLPHIGKLLQKYPDKTELFCSYLAALAEISPSDVAAQIGTTLLAGTYRTEWESAWLARTLQRVHAHVPQGVLEVAQAAVARPHGVWLFAMEAAKLLALRGELRREDLASLWNTCPRTLRIDLVIAAESLAGAHPWAEAFFRASLDDPVHIVVAKQLRQFTLEQGVMSANELAPASRAAV